MSNLQQQFNDSLKADLQKQLAVKNPYAVPTLSKIIINMGVKDALADKKNIERALSVMTQISGQKPKIAKAKKSIAGFKLREGDEIAIVVTLRGKRMYNFLQKLIAIVLPRIRDFRGVPRTSFDGKGNYSLGIREFTVFPEIDPGKIDRVQGLEVSLVTTARNNEEGMALLEKLGMPFQKSV